MVTWPGHASRAPGHRERGDPHSDPGPEPEQARPGCWGEEGGARPEGDSVLSA